MIDLFYIQMTIGVFLLVENCERGNLMLNYFLQNMFFENFKKFDCHNKSI